MSRDTMRRHFETAAFEWIEADRADRIRMICDDDDDAATADLLHRLVEEAESQVKKIGGFGVTEHLLAQAFLGWIDRRLDKERDRWEASRAEELERDHLSDEADHYVDMAKEED
jgi:hypothetical protein